MEKVLKKKKKSHQSWSWILMVSFFILSIVNIYFALLGFLCMTMPIYHAIKGRGKIHCSHYCPRGSFLGKFLSNLSFKRDLPSFMKTKLFKNILLLMMIMMLAVSIVMANGDIKLIGFSIFRFMLASSIVGIIMGIIFKPRSWCQVCPMGHGTGMISEIVIK